ncbi:MAG: RDD family protein [Pseudomonadota bacterium]
MTNAFPAAIWKRFAALLYDAFLVAALLFLATALGMLVAYFWGMDLEHSNPLTEVYAFKVYIMLVWFGYFHWSWYKRGQTLGMIAWKIRLVSLDGNRITVQQSALRFVFSLLGMMHLSGLFSPSKASLHDLLSKTQMIDLKKLAKKD